MWTQTSMTLPESLVTSLMGLCVVLGVLALLAVMVMVFAKIISAAEGTAKPKAQSAAPAQDRPDDEANCAVILSVICEELGAAPEELAISSIKEI